MRHGLQGGSGGGALLADWTDDIPDNLGMLGGDEEKDLRGAFWAAGPAPSFGE